MAKYEITGPDGKRYEVNAPHGASEDDAINYVKSNFYSAESKPDPYKETAQKQSALDNLLAGVGGGMTSLYLGGKQMLGKATPEEIAEHKQAMAGLRSTTSGTIGDIAGQIAAAVPTAFIPGAGTYAGSALIGGGMGALQPVDEQESRLTNTVVGGLGGVAGKYLGDKIIRAIRGKTNPNFGSVGPDPSAGVTSSQDKIMQRGQEMGMRLTPGQASGSKSLQQLEAKLESQPMTSGVFNEIKDNNQKVVNRLAAEAIGEQSDVLDSAVLGKAKDRISDVYKLVADDRPRQIPADDFINKFAAIESEFEGLLQTPLADNPLVKRLINFAETGQATGKQLQDIASKMGKVAANAMTTPSGDRQLGMALKEIKNIADDYLASGLNGDTAKLFDAARGQYRNLILLTQRNGVVNPSSGNVNGNALASLLQQKDKNGFLFGKNQSDFYDAARFAQAFRPIVGDSGTATRSPLPGPTDFILSLPTNLASRMYASSPSTKAAAAMMNLSNKGAAPGAPQIIDPAILKLLPLTGSALGANLQNY